MRGHDIMRYYIDDVLTISKTTFLDHLLKVDEVLCRIRRAGLKVNAKKSFFAKAELEYLGYWVTRKGIQSMLKKVDDDASRGTKNPVSNYADLLV